MTEFYAAKGDTRVFRFATKDKDTLVRALDTNDNKLYYGAISQNAIRPISEEEARKTTDYHLLEKLGLDKDGIRELGELEKSLVIERGNMFGTEADIIVEKIPEDELEILPGGFPDSDILEL